MIRLTRSQLLAYNRASQTSINCQFYTIFCVYVRKLQYSQLQQAMGCDFYYAEEDLYAIAAAVQRERSDENFRARLVWQDDFLSYDIVESIPDEEDQIFVYDDGTSFGISDMTSPCDIPEDFSYSAYRHVLYYEPEVRPDGRLEYFHHCRICDNGLPTPHAECVACGFASGMLAYEFNDFNQRAVDAFNTRVQETLRLSDRWAWRSRI